MAYGKLTEKDVSFEWRIVADEIPVRGNAQASGNANDDREVEDAILARLERGDETAWCCLTVTATCDATDESESAHLGAVSLEEGLFGGRLEARLRECFGDVWTEALDRLNAERGYTEDLDPRVDALARHLDCDPCELDQDGRHETRIEYGSQEYLVLDESERESEADERLESYIDDCLLEGVADPIKQYFDRAAWKRDALLSDGYGHTISSYDSEEHEQQVGETTWYIYRVN